MGSKRNMDRAFSKWKLAESAAQSARQKYENAQAAYQRVRGSLEIPVGEQARNEVKAVPDIKVPPPLDNDEFYSAVMTLLRPLLRARERDGGCTEEGCGCFGSQLANTLREMELFFSEEWKKKYVEVGEQVTAPLRCPVCNSPERGMRWINPTPVDASGMKLYCSHPWHGGEQVTAAPPAKKEIMMNEKEISEAQALIDSVPEGTGKLEPAKAVFPTAQTQPLCVNCHCPLENHSSTTGECPTIYLASVCKTKWTPPIPADPVALQRGREAAAILSKSVGAPLPAPTPRLDDEALADKLAPLLWEADEWWNNNRDRLVETADWAECVLLHMMPKLRAELGDPPALPATPPLTGELVDEDWEKVRALLEPWQEVWRGDREKFALERPRWMLDAAAELFAHDICDRWNWNEYVSAAATILERHFRPRG